MTGAAFSAEEYRRPQPENYEAYFVPAIGAPLAADLIAAARLHPDERVLDVACGTGVVTRLAAAVVGAGGAVAGLDVHPGMLAVARATSPDDISWYETSIEAAPLPGGAFDVVLCQMGLQFVADKPKALAEIRRVLADGGRVVLNLPGPTPRLFTELADALARHIDARCAGFVNAVFSLHDPHELRRLLTGAGFEVIEIARTPRTLRLPAPEDFLWQYIHSTPLADLVAKATDQQRAALATDVGARWQRFVEGGALTLEVEITTVRAQ